MLQQMKERIRAGIAQLSRHSPTATPGTAGRRTLQGHLPVAEISLAVIALVAVVFALDRAQPIFIPVTLAILFSYALYPFSEGLVKLGVPRAIAVGAVVLSLLAIAFLGTWGLRDNITQAVDRIPAAVQTLRWDMRAMRRSSETSMEKVQEAAQEISKAAEEAGGEKPPPEPGVERVQIEREVVDVRDYIWWGSLGIIAALAQFAVILLMVFLMLYSGDAFKHKLVSLAGPDFAGRRSALALITAINGQIRNYLVVLMVSALFVGILSWIAFLALGFEQAAVWGIAAGVLSAVPFLGPAIVFVGTSIMAYVQYETISMALIVGGTSLAITSIQGFALLPWLTSRATRINVLSLVVGMLFWGWLWGPWGVAFAHPILMIFKAVCDHVEFLQPVSVLLSVSDRNRSGADPGMATEGAGGAPARHTEPDPLAREARGDPLDGGDERATRAAT